MLTSQVKSARAPALLSLSTTIRSPPFKIFFEAFYTSPKFEQELRATLPCQLICVKTRMNARSSAVTKSITAAKLIIIDLFHSSITHET